MLSNDINLKQKCLTNFLALLSTSAAIFSFASILKFFNGQFQFSYISGFYYLHVYNLKKIFIEQMVFWNFPIRLWKNKMGWYVNKTRMDQLTLTQKTITKYYHVYPVISPFLFLQLNPRCAMCHHQEQTQTPTITTRLLIPPDDMS